MQLKLDMEKSYGIVLEGGGARGSYQIGAWKALKEAGVRIRGIAGASVGALNGALMCMDDLEKAEKIWENISYSQVMDVDENLMEDSNLLEKAEQAVRIIRDRGLDITPLRRMIEEAVDEERIRKSERELYVTTISLDDRKAMVLDVKELPEGGIADGLLASAYLPGFKQEKLGGKRYLDGGGMNNVPVDVLADRGYEDIIVIRIYGLGVDTERRLKLPEHVNVYHIAPRQNLGGILEFDKKKARRNMMLGYMDARRMLYGLEGTSYYFDAPQSEAYFFDKMMSELALVRHYISSELEEEEARRLEGYRAFTEQIFPALAREMKLPEDWNYKGLYLALLEKWAKELRMPRYCIYTPDQVVKRVHERLRKLDSRLPV